MFDLDQAIAAWRQQMLAAGIQTPVPLEELENHLREDIEEQMAGGTDAQQSFENSAGQLGGPAILNSEFVKTGETIHEHLKKLIFALAGIPNLQPVTNMNTTNSNIEPRWATYAKAGTFVFPAAFLWLFTVVFVLPKVSEICQAAGTTVFNFTNAPAIFRGSAVVGQGMIFLTSHSFLIGGTIILAFVLLERYFQQWPRYRRLVIGIGVFLLNAVVLLSLTLMIVSVLVVAPYLMHHGH
jgi:hypothetical protein